MFPTAGHQGDTLKNLTYRLTKIEERRDLALSSANVGIWDWYIKENKLTWDAGMLDIYNIGTDDFEVHYSSWANLVHPEDLVETEKSIRGCIEDANKEYFYRFRIKRENRWRVVSGFGNCIRNAHGEAIRMVGVNILEPDVCKEHHERLLKKDPCEICPSRFVHLYETI